MKWCKKWHFSKQFCFWTHVQNVFFAPQNIGLVRNHFWPTEGSSIVQKKCHFFGQFQTKTVIVQSVNSSNSFIWCFSGSIVTWIENLYSFNASKDIISLQKYSKLSFSSFESFRFDLVSFLYLTVFWIEPRFRFRKLKIPRFFLREVSYSSYLGWTKGLAGNSKSIYKVCWS